MSSLTGQSALATLTQSIESVSRVITSSGRSVCKRLRFHGEPLRLQCCDCTGDAKWMVTGWVGRMFEGDASLNPVGVNECPVLDVTEFSFQVARCWPSTPGPSIANDYDERDTAAADVIELGDILRSNLTGCAVCPSDFGGWCSRFALLSFEARRSATETPYGPDGAIPSECAGWQFTILTA